MENNRAVMQNINQAGFTIIEVLIALAIFSIGFMAVGALQISSLRTTEVSQQKTLAMEALNTQVALLRQTPLYATDVWRGGAFALSPEFTADHTNTNPGTVVSGQFTVSWWVDNPQTIPNRWTPTPNPLLFAENVTVTVARTSDLNNVLNTVELVKYWVTDN